MNEESVGHLIQPCIYINQEFRNDCAVASVKIDARLDRHNAIGVRGFVLVCTVTHACDCNVSDNDWE
jgi:hypothetical protein